MSLTAGNKNWPSLSRPTARLQIAGGLPPVGQRKETWATVFSSLEACFLFLTCSMDASNEREDCNAQCGKPPFSWLLIAYKIEEIKLAINNHEKNGGLTRGTGNYACCLSAGNSWPMFVFFIFTASCHFLYHQKKRFTRRYSSRQD